MNLPIFQTSISRIEHTNLQFCFDKFLEPEYYLWIDYVGVFKAFMMLKKLWQNCLAWSQMIASTWS